MAVAPTAQQVDRETPRLAASNYRQTTATREWQLRASKVREFLDIAHGVGLEIGPLHLPLVTKDEGRVFYADYKPQDKLIEHYRQDPDFPLDDIVAIDYVLAGRTLVEAVGSDTRFDYVVASHVIEHCPDVIGWLRQIASLLRPGGLLALAVPDKRFTFDYFRTCSTTGDLLEAFLHELSLPSPKQIIDHYQNVAAIDASVIWSGTFDEQTFQKQATLTEGFRLAAEAATKGRYVEVHSYVFTPESFLDILRSLFALDLLPYRLKSFHETWRPGNEFVLTLERLDDDLDAESRRALQTASVPTLPRVPSESFHLTNASPPTDLNQMERIFAEKDAHIADARRQLAITEARLASVLGSRSWTLTEPLRRLAQYFRVASPGR